MTGEVTSLTVEIPRLFPFLILPSPPLSSPSLPFRLFPFLLCIQLSVYPFSHVVLSSHTVLDSVWGSGT